MDNKKTYYFKEIRDKLPEHVAPESAWENITDHFKKREKDTRLNLNYKALPVHEPDERIWGRIEQKLKVGGKTFNLKPAIFVKVVATILIAVGISALLITLFKTNKYKIYYSSESEESSSVFEDQPLEIDDLAGLIKSTCIQKPTICQDKFYIELENELKALESEKNKIEKEYLKNNNNQLFIYLHYIEDQKIEIQKKILQLSNNI